MTTECSICLDTIKLPYKLSCSHQFCYLCLKFTLMNTKLWCPLCRQDVNATVIDNAEINKDAPENDDNNEAEAEAEAEAEISPSAIWLYEGRRHGQWQFDEDANQQLEDEYQKWLQNGCPSIDDEAVDDYTEENENELVTKGFTLILIGKIYSVYINFQKMYQYNPKSGAFRYIKRTEDIGSESRSGSRIGHGIKGIAGLRM